MVWVIVAVVAVGIFATLVFMLRRGKGGSAVGKADVPAPETQVPEGAGGAAPGTAAAKMEEVASAAPADREAAGPELGAARKAGALGGAEPPGASSGPAEAPPVAGEVGDEVEAAGRAARTEAELPEQARAELEEAARLLDELRDVVSVLEGTDSTVEGSVEIMGEGLQEVRALTEKGQWGQARDKGAALKAQLSLLLQSARREPTA